MKEHGGLELAQELAKGSPELQRLADESMRTIADQKIRLETPEFYDLVAKSASLHLGERMAYGRALYFTALQAEPDTPELSSDELKDWSGL